MKKRKEVRENENPALLNLYATTREEEKIQKTFATHSLPGIASHHLPSPHTAKAKSPQQEYHLGRPQIHQIALRIARPPPPLPPRRRTPQRPKRPRPINPLLIYPPLGNNRRISRIRLPIADFIALTRSLRQDTRVRSDKGGEALYDLDFGGFGKEIVEGPMGWLFRRGGEDGVGGVQLGS